MCCSAKTATNCDTSLAGGTGSALVLVERGRRLQTIFTKKSCAHVGAPSNESPVKGVDRASKRISLPELPRAVWVLIDDGAKWKPCELLDFDSRRSIRQSLEQIMNNVVYM